MRTFIAVSLLILAFAGKAQTIVGQTYIQQTVMGLQKGAGVRTNFSKWGLGVVAQSAQTASMEKGSSNYPMIAVEGIVPITRQGNITFSLTPKVGLVNEQFLAFIPEVETDIKVFKWVHVAVAAGLRSREASTSVKLFITL